MSRRKQYTNETKLNVVLEVLREEQTVNEIAGRYGVHPNMVGRWKQEFFERAPDIFKRGMSDAEKELREERTHVAALERKVGQLTYEVDWLKKNLKKFSDTDQRLQIVDKSERRISVKRQASLVEVNRSSIYRPASRKRANDEEHVLRGYMDRLHTDNPTWGYRTITSFLQREYGLKINRKIVRRILRDMGLYAIYPKPNLSKRYHAAHIRPYLLRHMAITEPDQVWGVDITYVHFGAGFMYLFVIIDWYSRCIVDYELSGTLDKTFVLNSRLSPALRAGE